jgi:ABC-type sugar transport system ATPase subunit
VGMLSGGQRQAVAIAKALVQGADIVIMDEPTAALGVTESARVLELARGLADDGKAVLIISHNLQQIWGAADRFMVLHLGQIAGIRAKPDTTVDEIVRLIVYGGAPLPDEAPA